MVYSTVVPESTKTSELTLATSKTYKSTSNFPTKTYMIRYKIAGFVELHSVLEAP